jgi:hypothetical protein
VSDLGSDENTQTISVGSHDWLEASKNTGIRSYFPSEGNTYKTTVPVKHTAKGGIVVGLEGDLRA